MLSLLITFKDRKRIFAFFEYIFFAHNIYLNKLSIKKINGIRSEHKKLRNQTKLCLSHNNYLLHKTATSGQSLKQKKKKCRAYFFE